MGEVAAGAALRATPLAVPTSAPHPFLRGRAATRRWGVQSSRRPAPAHLFQFCVAHAQQGCLVAGLLFSVPPNAMHGRRAGCSARRWTHQASCDLCRPGAGPIDQPGRAVRGRGVGGCQAHGRQLTLSANPCCLVPLHTCCRRGTAIHSTPHPVFEGRSWVARFCTGSC